MKGFRDYILRGNVVDLAVAVVIGGAFGAVVTALVKDIVTPLIGAFGGTPDFSALSFSINNSQFMIGDFINSLISFVVIAAVIYFVVVTPMNKILEKVRKGQKVDPQTKICPECLSAVPLASKRCKFCTSVLKK